MRALVKSILSRIATATLVQVLAVSNAGGVEPVGTVDIKVLVNQVDGFGNSLDHVTIYGCPYSRLQGGANAVILDPQVGDIGIAVFTSHDISSVIATKAQANPGSHRKFDWADALYIGGTLNGTPTQFVQFSTDGIRLQSLTAVRLQAPEVAIQCQTLEIIATTGASVTTPTWTVNGDQITTGSQEVRGDAVFAADASVAGTLKQGGVDVGAEHIHDDVKAGGDKSGGVFVP